MDSDRRAGLLYVCRFLGLVTNYGEGEGGGYKTEGGGGATKREGGGHVKFYPYRKGGGGGKSFSHAEGGHNKFWGSFYVVA